MSDREKRKLLIKEAPEIFGLIEDFKSNFFFCYMIFLIVIYFILAHMKNAQEKLSPLLKLVKSGDVTKTKFTEFVQCYYEIILK